MDVQHHRFTHCHNWSLLSVMGQRTWPSGLHEEHR